jgi:hypothetical protein
MMDAAWLRTRVIQRFGVNQNSTEARYALDSEPPGRLGEMIAADASLCVLFQLVQCDIYGFPVRLAHLLARPGPSRQAL